VSRQHVTALENRAAVARVDAVAHTAALDRQATAAIGAKASGVGERRLTMWTAEAVGMEMLFEPRYTGVGIKQGQNWEIHVHQYTNCIPSLHYLYC